MIKQSAIDKFLDDLASQKATPGGGSAAAIIRFPSQGIDTAYPAGRTQAGVRAGDSFESVRYELDLRTPVEQQLEWQLALDADVVVVHRRHVPVG